MEVTGLSIPLDSIKDKFPITTESFVYITKSSTVLIPSTNEAQRSCNM